jgi:hypothetical protein
MNFSKNIVCWWGVLGSIIEMIISVPNFSGPRNYQERIMRRKERGRSMKCLCTFSIKNSELTHAARVTKNRKICGMACMHMHA